MLIYGFLIYHFSKIQGKLPMADLFDFWGAEARQRKSKRITRWRDVADLNF